MIVIVDSDGLLGSLNSEDVHYRVANEVLQLLQAAGAKLVYPATVIAEATALLQIRLNKPMLAKHIFELLLEEKLEVEPVDDMVLKQATTLLGSGQKKHNTLFDAIVAVVAKKHRADGIFSFDKFYKQKGFKLAVDL